MLIVRIDDGHEVWLVCSRRPRLPHTYNFLSIDRPSQRLPHCAGILLPAPRRQNKATWQLAVRRRAAHRCEPYNWPGEFAVNSGRKRARMANATRFCTAYHEATRLRLSGL